MLRLFSTPTERFIEDECVFMGPFVSQVNSGKEKLYYEGITWLSKTILLQVTRKRVIVGDCYNHVFLKVNDENVSEIQHKVVLDLNDEGMRWEGDVMNNQPYGWGILYNKEGEMVYEGFRIGEVNVCYGIQYYADIGVMEYEGGWFEGKRWGRGIQYDRNGAVLFDGEWLNDGHEFEKRAIITKDNQFLHNYIEELIVSDNCCNEEEWNFLDLHLYNKLKLIKCGDHCFKNVEHTRITDLPELSGFVTGEYCFSNKKEGEMHDYFRSFVLRNCPNLQSLEIGSSSFFGCTICEVESLPSLQTASFGDFCFCFSSLELRGKEGWIE